MPGLYLVQLAKQVQSSASAVVCCCLASKPVYGTNQGALWRAMLYALSKPAECGPKVDGVSKRGMSGYMQRTMRLLEEPGSGVVIRPEEIEGVSHGCPWRSMVEVRAPGFRGGLCPGGAAQ